MYLDPACPTSSMRTDQDVNEATAALKGMLGLGTAPVPAPASAAAAAVSSKGNPPLPLAVTPNSKSKKKTNNNKNKKKGYDKKEEQKIKDSNNYRGGENSKSKKKNARQKKVPKEPETYALSAFQSSPDASKLPIPEFISPVNEKETIKLESVAEFKEEHLLVQTNSGENKPNSDKQEQKGENKEEEKEIDNESRNDAPVSKTGVNLAALAAKPLQTSDPVSPPPVSVGPQTQQLQHPMHFPQSPPPHFNLPHMQQYPQYPGFSPHHHHHPAHHQHPYPPPPPPGYVMIQVQVPPVLMPGRQMVVQSPGGYPVQVVVPDGIPPGTWLPVHVPAGPPHMLPHPMMQQQPPPQYNTNNNNNPPNYNPRR